MDLTLRREYYWPHLANVPYATVWNCTSCAATRGNLVNNEKDFKLFTAVRPLEFVAVVLLVLLSKMVQGNPHVLVIANRLTELTRSIPQHPASEQYRLGCCKRVFGQLD